MAFFPTKRQIPPAVGGLLILVNGWPAGGSRKKPPARPASDRDSVWYMGDHVRPWSPPATPGAPPGSGFVAFHQLAFCSPGRSRPHLGMGGVFFSSEGVCTAYLRPVRPPGGVQKMTRLPLWPAQQGVVGLCGDRMGACDSAFDFVHAIQLLLQLACVAQDVLQNTLCRPLSALCKSGRAVHIQVQRANFLQPCESRR